MFLYLAAKVYTCFFDGIRFQEKSIVWNTRKTDSILDCAISIFQTKYKTHYPIVA
jgi:hypothetical protein